MEESNSEIKRPPEKPLLTSDILLAKYYQLKELPGFFRRYLALGEQEYGLKLSSGQVVEKLPPSTKGIVRKSIGWAFLGLEERSAIRLWTSPVHLRPSLFRMASGDEPPLPVDIFLSVAAQITDPARFYNTLPTDKNEYRCSDLANEIASCLEKPLQKKLRGYDAQTLSLDDRGIVTDTLAQELLKEPTLQDFLASRGVSLKSLSILSIIPSEAEDQLVQEVEALRGQVIEGGAQIGALLEKVAAPLKSQGLATPEEVEKLKTTYAESPQNGQALLGGLMERFAQWREEQLQSRLAQLAIKDKAIEKGKVTAKKGKGWLPIVIYSLLAIAIGSGSVLLYWFRFSKLGNLDLNPSHIIAGASILALLGVGLLVITQVVVDRLLHFVISKIKEHLLRQRLSRDQKAITKTETAPVEDSRNGVEANISQPVAKPIVETTTPTKVEVWLTQESLKTDEIIRRQVGRELSLATTNLNEARHYALRQKQNGLAQSVKSLVERVAAFQARVEGAAFYGSIISSGKGQAPDRPGQARGRANQIIAFEEDMQRQAQLFELTSQKLLELVQDNPDEGEAQVKSAAASLRQLEHHFSRRDAVMEGVAVPGAGAIK